MGKLLKNDKRGTAKKKEKKIKIFFIVKLFGEEKEKRKLFF